MGLPRLLRLQVVTLGLAGSTGLELPSSVQAWAQQPGQPQGPVAARGSHCLLSEVGIMTSEPLFLG